MQLKKLHSWLEKINSITENRSIYVLPDKSSKNEKKDSITSKQYIKLKAHPIHC